MPWVQTIVRETFGIGQYEPETERSKLPLTSSEQIFHDEPYRTTQRTIESGQHKISNITWEFKDTQPVADVIHIHGLHDYGTRWAETAWPKKLVDEGFRVTTPDLIGHGRSTGIHGGFTSIDEQVDVVKDVLLAVKGLPPSKSGKIFLLGGSLGGLILLSYAVKYGQDSQAAPTGMVVLCPLVEAAAESRPSWAVEVFAKSLSSLAPFLPLAEANRGKNASDIRFEEAFMNDPMTYHGRLRIGTGLAMLYGFKKLQTHLSDIKTPFIVIHGDADRATSSEGSKLLYERATSQDKTIRIFEGQEHDLMREPKSLEILDTSIKWLKKHI